MFELDVNRYHRAESLVGGVPFNNLFARVVLENKVRGRVLVDDKDSPSVCLVVHKYGMALLCGTPTNESFYRELGGFLRNDALNDGTARWILCHPSDWDLTFARLLGRDLVDATGPVDEDVPQADGLEHVVRIERVNFQFNTNQRPGQAEPPSGFVLKRINASLFDRITGSVVPQAF